MKIHIFKIKVFETYICYVLWILKCELHGNSEIEDEFIFKNKIMKIHILHIFKIKVFETYICYVLWILKCGICKKLYCFFNNIFMSKNINVIYFVKFVFN
jgi:hypothetical protein